MRRALFTGSSLLIAAVLMAGCTTNLPATIQVKAVSQSEARDLAFKYRQQASDLSELAKRQELEAQWLTGHFGPTDDQVRVSHEKAQRLWAAADQAEQLARDYRRQVPHGQVN